MTSLDTDVMDAALLHLPLYAADCLAQRRGLASFRTESRLCGRAQGMKYRRIIMESPALAPVQFTQTVTFALPPDEEKELRQVACSFRHYKRLGFKAET